VAWVEGEITTWIRARISDVRGWDPHDVGIRPNTLGGEVAAAQRLT
jgi:hypothetical protein